MVGYLPVRLHKVNHKVNHLFNVALCEKILSMAIQFLLSFCLQCGFLVNKCTISACHNLVVYIIL